MQLLNNINFSKILKIKKAKLVLIVANNTVLNKKIAKNSICRLLFKTEAHLFRGPICIMCTDNPETLEKLNLEIYGGFLNGSFLSLADIKVLIKTGSVSKPYLKLRSINAHHALRYNMYRLYYNFKKR